mmetsp:Transcript_66222/g.190342  ORF Transcript_66222/g.190342 Transcript_66222/m.190342 type:complete len:294 (+) Transcript_66222:22-903(+)
MAFSGDRRALQVGPRDDHVQVLLRSQHLDDPSRISSDAAHRLDPVSEPDLPSIHGPVVVGLHGATRNTLDNRRRARGATSPVQAQLCLDVQLDCEGPSGSHLQRLDPLRHQVLEHGDAIPALPVDRHDEVPLPNAPSVAPVVEPLDGAIFDVEDLEGPLVKQVQVQTHAFPLDKRGNRNIECTSRKNLLALTLLLAAVLRRVRGREGELCARQESTLLAAPPPEAHQARLIDLNNAGRHARPQDPSHGPATDVRPHDHGRSADHDVAHLRALVLARLRRSPRKDVGLVEAKGL